MAPKTATGSEPLISYHPLNRTYSLPGFLFHKEGDLYVPNRSITPEGRWVQLMGINSEIIRGHDLLAVERFRDDTKHMIIFDVLTRDSPLGEKDQRLRLFLNNEGYAKAQESQRKGEIKILRHASIIEGHIVPDKKSKRHHAK